MILQKKGRYGRAKKPVLKQTGTSAKIKVRLDSKTTITIHNLSTLKMWQEKYPEAAVIVE